jgi:predicted Holliday junction resolvase-like endonuclease
MPWDGDDLAGQMEENLERQQAAAEARAKSPGSAEDRARNAQLESLRLSRSRILGQLSRATVPAHRTMLERALQAIDDQMSGKQ